MARICPDCNEAMTQLSFFGVELDTCKECAGIFFDDGEMASIRKAAGSIAFEQLDRKVQPKVEFVRGEENQVRRCPACNIRMDRIRYMYTSPVFLDSCDGCGGVWIENGELQQISDYLKADRGIHPVSSTENSAHHTFTAADQEKTRKAWENASLLASQGIKP